MNVHATYLWLVWPQEAWADITQPRPYFEQNQLPPPDLPPYLFPWSTVWTITPIVLIVVVLFIRTKQQQSKREIRQE